MGTGTCSPFCCTTCWWISDEKATGELLTAIRRSGLDIQGTLSDWGAPNLNVFNRTAPLEEIAHLLAGLYRGEFISPEAQAIILN